MLSIGIEFMKTNYGICLVARSCNIDTRKAQNIILFHSLRINYLFKNSDILHFYYLYENTLR